MLDSPARPAPGLMILQSNSLEQLRQLLLTWMARHPLGVLQAEQLLVQSNGIAQWLKQALAEDDQHGAGIAAGLNICLPARFIWQQAYRALMPELPRVSAFDKEPLSWRILQLLQQSDLWQQSGMQPLAQYWQQSRGQHPTQGLFLAKQLADLYDQYQQYRADWLQAWQQGEPSISKSGQPQPLRPDNQWQALLWQQLYQQIQQDPELSPAAKIGRDQVHRLFIAQSQQLSRQQALALPPRVIVFGISSLSQQSLEVLQALAKEVQVMLFVLNPSPYYWGDLLPDSLELANWLKDYQRHPKRADASPMPRLGQPLLANWGRQGRDYLKLLDSLDQRSSYEPLWQQERLSIDLFSPPDEQSMLGQLQADNYHLRHLSEAGPRPVAAEDQSLSFMICHSAMREVEVLHDRLLWELQQAKAQGRELHPRDILVMVPRIEDYSAKVRAVFQRYERSDPRHLPFHLCDQGLSEQDPILRAALLLVRLPRLRLTSQELSELLALPCVRQRFNLSDSLWPVLQGWIQDSGIRWGLNGAHKEGLGLPAEAQNSWRFGLERMLLGYASGEQEHWQQIAPLASVGGMAAEAVGALAELLERLQHWLPLLQQERSLADWLGLLPQLWQDFFAPSDADEQLVLSQMLQSLEQWQQELSLEQWQQCLSPELICAQLEQLLQRPSFGQRFVSGAINFATLMPMRAIPFKQIWLLGMNEQDYPRRAQVNDFDLMQQDYRPGDRSRRDDDRYLFLEALLSAREKLVISWHGRNIRDNSELPPSVLVAQLRDHLARGWCRPEGDLLSQLTLVTPMQPFSSQYCRADRPAEQISYAKEWFAAPQQPASPMHQPLSLNLTMGKSGNTEQPLSLLKKMLESPWQAYFQQGLGIAEAQEAEALDEQEPLAIAGLEQWQLQQGLLPLVQQAQSESQLLNGVERLIHQWQRQGLLAPGALAELQGQQISQGCLPMWQAWQELKQQYPQTILPPRRQQLACQGILWQQDLPGLQRNAQAELLQTYFSSSGLYSVDAKGKKTRRLKHWLLPYLLHLLACCQQPVQTAVLSLAGRHLFAALSAEDALAQLDKLTQAWLRNGQQPWACELGMLKDMGQELNPLSSDKLSGYWQQRLSQEPRLYLLFGEQADALSQQHQQDAIHLYQDFYQACLHKEDNP